MRPLDEITCVVDVSRGRLRVGLAEDFGMNVKILGSLFVVGLVSSFVGYGTYAYFSDTETSAGNVFTAGSLNLLVNEANGVTGTISAPNMAPGESVSGSVVLRNAGSITHDLVLDLTGTAIVTDAGANPADPDDGGVSATGINHYLIVTAFTYNGASLLGSYTDTNTDGKISLAEIVARGTLAGLTDPGVVGKTLTMTMTLDTITPNHIKHDSATMTLTFNLAQNSVPPAV